jgi:hypothetical protein
MKTNLNSQKLKTAKTMLLLAVFMLSACNPYRYAYKASKAEQKALQKVKGSEVKND